MNTLPEYNLDKTKQNKTKQVHVLVLGCNALALFLSTSTAHGVVTDGLALLALNLLLSQLRESNTIIMMMMMRPNLPKHVYFLVFLGLPIIRKV